MSAHLTYCFYGAGSAAEAVVKGMLDKKTAQPEHIQMINRSNQERLQELKDRYNVHASNEPELTHEWLRTADVIILAMKPKDAVQALQALRPALASHTMLVSLIAGLSIATIQRIVGPSSVVRTMPNTSSTIGLGATGVCYSREVSEEQYAIARAMLGAIGIVAEVDEKDMDAITGVSGSGPAYVYYIMEALIEAAVSEGLTAEQAESLVIQTVRGAAEMVRITGESPAVLRRKVTSPGGTTEVALKVLQECHVNEAMKAAVAHARARAAEMGEQIGSEL